MGFVSVPRKKLFSWVLSIFWRIIPHIQALNPRLAENATGPIKDDDAQRILDSGPIAQGHHPAGFNQLSGLDINDFHLSLALGQKALQTIRQRPQAVLNHPEEAFLNVGSSGNGMK